MEEPQERSMAVQQLVVKSDPETISKMTAAYESLRRSHEASEENQRLAQQRIEDERRGRAQRT